MPPEQIVLGSPRTESPVPYPQDDRARSRQQGAPATGHGRSQSLPRPNAQIASHPPRIPSQQVTFPEPNPAAAPSTFEVHQPTYDSARTKPVEPLGTYVLPHQNMEQVGGFWERYNKAADFEDNEFVTALGDNLDNLLIFAGLFSGVNTAFIIESLKTIQEDRAETTNELMRTIIGVLQNNMTSEDPRKETPFQAPNECVRSTTIFFCSLCCSISAAFGAVLAKQWLNYYKREGRLKPPASRGREHQMKYEGRALWRVEGIIETLPTILQLSLFLFLIALVDFLHPINKDIGWVVMAFSLVPVMFYIFTTIIATNHPLSPFQTRLSITIRSVLPKIPGLCSCVAKDIWEHPINELRTMLNLEDKLGPMHFIPRALCSTIFVVFTWPACLAWRLLYTIAVTPHRLWQIVRPPPQQAEDKAILDLKCQIFYMERASTPEDVKHVLEATQTIPTTPELNHPIIETFADTLVKFILKPTQNSKTGPGMYTSGNPSIKFHKLINVIHLFYLGWASGTEQAYSLPTYLGGYVKWFRDELWKVFAQYPQNVELVKLIAEIMEETKTEGVIDCPEESQSVLCRCLQLPALDETLYHPYITLLGSRPIKKYSELTPRECDERRNVIPALASTMIINDQADLDYTRCRVRAEVLEDMVTDMENANPKYPKMFVKYLQRCCNYYTSDQDIPPEASDTVRACLLAIFKMLHRYDGEKSREGGQRYQKWTHVLEKSEYTPLLEKLVKRRVHPALAVMCFISQWNRRRDSTTTSMVDGDIGPYLKEATISAVVSCFRAMAVSKSATEDFNHADLSAINFTLIRVVDYFEQASTLKRLRKHSIVQDWISLAEDYVPDTSHRERLRRKMEKLTFV